MQLSGMSLPKPEVVEQHCLRQPTLHAVGCSSPMAENRRTDIAAQPVVRTALPGEADARTPITPRVKAMVYVR
jgi:hypothetical protein